MLLSDLEAIWRNKTDGQVATAYAHLSDYMPDAQAVIRAEYERRQALTGTPPQAVEVSDDQFEGLILASRGDRVSAQILDSLIAFAPLIAVFVISFVSPVISDFLAYPALLFFVLYLLFADALRGGQSLGKKGLGLSVITLSTRQPCSIWRSLVRNLSLTVLGMIDWIFIFGKMRQRLGDMMAGTIVIRVRE